MQNFALFDTLIDVLKFILRWSLIKSDNGWLTFIYASMQSVKVLGQGEMLGNL